MNPVDILLSANLNSTGLLNTLNIGNGCRERADWEVRAQPKWHLGGSRLAIGPPYPGRCSKLYVILFQPVWVSPNFIIWSQED
jgi:hypothetical protein